VGNGHKGGEEGTNVTNMRSKEGKQEEKGGRERWKQRDEEGGGG